MNVAVVLALAGIAIGYALGRAQPLRAAREWARWKVWVGKDIGRVESAAVIALLPETFVPLLWHRVRHGRYPQLPSKRRAPVPAMVRRPQDPPRTPQKPQEGSTAP